jgi:hypothetical protein
VAAQQAVAPLARALGLGDHGIGAFGRGAQVFAGAAAQLAQHGGARAVAARVGAGFFLRQPVVDGGVQALHVPLGQRRGSRCV